LGTSGTLAPAGGNLDLSFQSIFKTIEEQGQPFLKSTNTVESFYKKFYKEKKENIRILEAIAYASILVENRDKQNKLLKVLIVESEDNPDNISWITQIKEDAQFMLNHRTQVERERLLKLWANETIEYLKLPNIKPFTL
jgi:hypothetical protein